LKRSIERMLWIFTLVTIIGIFYIVPQARPFKNENEFSYYDNLFKTSLQYLKDYYVDSDKTDIKDLYYGAIQGMYKASGDAYTTLLEPKMLQGLMESIQGEFEGIGAYVGVKDSRIVIISPIEGTPAYKAGVRPGDLIMKINDKDTENMKLEEAVSLLRGPADSKVKVSFYRKGVLQPIDIELKRKKIEIPSIRETMLANKIGYIKIINFGEKTTEELEKALDNLSGQGMKKLIIDLRYNPGGALNAVVDMADLFLDKGLVVYTVGKDSSETKKFFSSDNTSINTKVPMAVLINGGSASASEILAGALKDRKRAVVVGEKSYGKGTVQNVFKILDKDEMLGLKITIAKYYTPGGYVIDKNGIEPDIKVDMPKMEPEEELASIKILEGKYIEKFVDKNKKKIPDADFKALKKELASKNLIVKDLFLKKLIRSEQSYLEGPQIIDLEYDTQLQKAIEVLK